MTKKATRGKRLLLTPKDIRSALQGTYKKLRYYDQHQRQRRKTRSVHDLFPKETCACCGKAPNRNWLLQTSHIESLEEGGVTNNCNLLPLCSHKLTPDVTATGCHEFFERGYASAIEMENARESWLRGQTSKRLRHTMEQRYACHEHRTSQIAASKKGNVQALITSGALRLAHCAQLKLLSKASNKVEEFRATLKLVEIDRKRAARGALDQAEARLRALRNRPIPRNIRSYFFYEEGYVYLLKGCHRKAEASFKRSLRCTSPNTPEHQDERVPASALLAQSQVARLGIRASAKQKARLRQLLDAAEVSTKSRSNIHVRRWKLLNLPYHQARLSLVYHQNHRARQYLGQALANWRAMTVDNGWDWVFRRSLVELRGLVLSAHALNLSEVRKALAYLSRALTTMIGRDCRNPERIRDVLMAAARCLDRLREKEHARRARRVARQTRDGASWQYPYRVILQ